MPGSPSVSSPPPSPRRGDPVDLPDPPRWLYIARMTTEGFPTREMDDPMTKHAADPGLAQAHVEIRRARIRDLIDRPLEVPGADADPLPADRIEHLCREAEDLYWNELSWEELTDEEEISGGHLTELVFPGFLSFVEALLIETVPADSLAPARPHPDVVEAILAFLAERYTVLTAELEAGADSERVVWARAMTARLIDLVLYRLYELTPAEQERIDEVA